MTESDAIQLNRLYECPDVSSTSTPTITAKSTTRCQDSVEHCEAWGKQGFCSNDRFKVCFRNIYMNQDFIQKLKQMLPIKTSGKFLYLLYLVMIVGSKTFFSKLMRTLINYLFIKSNHCLNTIFYITLKFFTLFYSVTYRFL